MMVFKHMCIPASHTSMSNKTLQRFSWQAKLECNFNLDPELKMQTVKRREISLPLSSDFSRSISITVTKQPPNACFNLSITSVDRASNTMSAHITYKHKNAVLVT